jgi:hypothetical protein
VSGAARGLPSTAREAHPQVGILVRKPGVEFEEGREVLEVALVGVALVGLDRDDYLMHPSPVRDGDDDAVKGDRKPFGALIAKCAECSAECPGCFSRHSAPSSPPPA